jgi:hypothetical protein
MSAFSHERECGRCVSQGRNHPLQHPVYVMSVNRQYPIKLIINVEAQGRASLSYEVETRGIYYCCRVISSQYGKELKNLGEI